MDIVHGAALGQRKWIRSVRDPTWRTPIVTLTPQGMLGKRQGDLECALGTTWHAP